MEKWLGFPPAQEYHGVNLSNLPLNHAYVTANTNVSHVGVFSVKESCFNCPYQLAKYLKAGEEAIWQVDTSVQNLWRILITDEISSISRTNRRGILCQMKPTLREYGVYKLDVGRCQVTTEVEPTNSYLPFYLCLLVLLGLYTIYGLIKIYKNRNKRDKQEKSFQVNTDRNENSTRTLHIFKDLLMLCLIFSTTGGGGYSVFNNEWAGLSMGECLFFAYVWTVGVNIPSTMDECANRQTKCAITRSIFKRGFVLIFLGIATDAVSNCKRLDYIVLWCPLQRLGIAYIVVASLYVLTVQKFDMKSKRTICKAIGNLVSLMWCWIFSGLLLAIIIIMTSALMSFNCLSDAGFVRKADYEDIIPEVTNNCYNVSSAYANKLLVGESKEIVNANGYVDYSRGVMGILMTILCTMIGVKAGAVYLDQSHANRLKLWGFWSTLFGLGGVIFAVVSYPFNFNLWPISTTIFISSTSLYLFSILYLFTDVMNFPSILPESYKSVSLAILCGHQLFSNNIPFRWDMHFNSHILYLMQSFSIVFLWLIISRVLVKKIKLQI